MRTRKTQALAPYVGTSKMTDVCNMHREISRTNWYQRIANWYQGIRTH